MKKLLAIVLALLLTALPCLGLAEAPYAAETPYAAQGATLTITGSATVTLKADYAEVSVGVSTTAPTVAEATRLNTQDIRTVIDALKDAGIPEEDIATSSYSVYAQYDYSSLTGAQTLAGYNVTNQLMVIIRDMEHIGATLDKATEAGANNIYNIQFLSTKTDEAQDEAMVYAVQDALRRAQLLAGAAGLTLGGIVSISDSSSGWVTSTRTYESKVTMDAVSNAILPDNASVSASVTMVFELK